MEGKLWGIMFTPAGTEVKTGRSAFAANTARLLMTVRSTPDPGQGFASGIFSFERGWSLLQYGSMPIMG